MSSWINYHHLYYFKTIAEEESVSKAAKKLRLGQPTLSAQLKQFENTLGVLLFERKHKKLILTEQGRLALDYAKNIFKMGSEMYEVLHDRHRPQRISLQIGSLDSIAKQIILELAEKALQIAPCHITLIEGKADELFRELTTHRLDLLVSNFIPSANNARGFFHRLITKKPVSIYGAPKYEPFKKKFPQSISGKSFLVPTYDSKLRHDFDHWIKSLGLSVEIVAESQDIAVKKLMAINGLGLMPTASHTVMRQVHSGELIEIGKLEGVYEELFLVKGNRRIENPIAKSLFKGFDI